MDYVVHQLLFYKDGFLNKPTKVDMQLNKETKQM